MSATPGQAAYRDVPPVFSRWCRAGNPSMSDYAILMAWRVSTDARRAFWVEDPAAREPHAAPGGLGTAWRLLEELRKQVRDLADGLLTSAAATHPSKKSAIEFELARKLQALIPEAK